jgi:hypothetical protein
VSSGDQAQAGIAAGDDCQFPAQVDTGHDFGSGAGGVEGGCKGGLKGDHEVSPRLSEASILGYYHWTKQLK